MSSSDAATLRVISPHDAIEVSVLDGNFGVVAEGTGSLETKLAPGIYELQVRVGATQQRRLIKLGPREVHEERPQLADPNAPSDPDAVRLSVWSAAPVGGTSTTREDHMDAAFEASETLKESGARTGVVVMIRLLRNSRAKFDSRLVERVSLVDADLNPVRDQRRAGDGWLTLTMPLEPGGYALRVESPDGSGPTFQSVWAADGWQTLVFVGVREGGLATERAAIHMTRMQDPWQPHGDRRDIDLAVEAARWSLREGRPGMSPELLRLLLYTKFRNPMLGIIGAHVLLLAPTPNLRQLDTVVGNLTNLVRDHPDVRALEWLLQDAKGSDFSSGGAISWPPMLFASYTAAIRRDAYDPGAIVDESPAEAFAAHLLVTGVWTTWRQPAAMEQEHATRGFDEMPPAAADDRDPAAARVLEYVDTVATRRGQDRTAVLEKVDERRCAIGTGLPTGTVRRVLRQLRA